jgi:16S rRNA (uracil1498-N3)-methyltransferase
VPLAPGTELVLPPQPAHHAARVLRLKTGDAVTLFNGEGGEFAARLIRIDARIVVAAIDARRAVERESPLNVTLAQGLATAERMDSIVQKSVELGVGAIVPLATARSVSKLDQARAARRLEHWRKIAMSACEQCGRNRLPEIFPIIQIEAWLSQPAAASLRLMLAPDAAESLAAIAQPEGKIELLIGPEGGFAPEETAAAKQAKFRAVRLGPRVLRTETAAPAALAALNALCGDWR